MMRSYYRAIHWMRTSLVLINYAILLLYTGVFLIGTKFIVAQQKSLFFLSQLSHVPKNPVFVLSGCMGLYGLFLSGNDPKQKAAFSIFQPFDRMGHCFSDHPAP